MIGGERGTGKNLIASAVHSLSNHAVGPFVTVDCAAVPESQVWQALSGALQSVDGGTLVLDGVGGLSVDLQARVLRFLRNGEIAAQGKGTRRLDTRIISITDTDLEPAIESGRFREALYYELNVLSITAPPLRERGRDIQVLADFFLDKFTSPSSRRRVVGFTAEARLAMQQWSWPGNVRELVSRIKKAIVMCEKGPLYSVDLDLDERSQGRLMMTLDEARDAAELSALLTALAATNGNLAIAAEKLEISRAAICRLIRKHGLDLTTPQLVIDAER
jgi:DNA-binding NtrC family response regulator